jgi:hypothetical protein
MLSSTSEGASSIGAIISEEESFDKEISTVSNKMQ